MLCFLCSFSCSLYLVFCFLCSVTYIFCTTFLHFIFFTLFLYYISVLHEPASFCAFSGYRFLLSRSPSRTMIPAPKRKATADSIRSILPAAFSFCLPFCFTAFVLYCILILAIFSLLLAHVFSLLRSSIRKRCAGVLCNGNLIFLRKLRLLFFCMRSLPSQTVMTILSCHS